MVTEWLQLHILENSWSHLQTYLPTYTLLWFSFPLFFPPPPLPNAREYCPAHYVGRVILTIILAVAPLAQKSASHYGPHLEMREPGSSYVVKWMDILLSLLQIQDFYVSRDLVKQEPIWYGWWEFKNLLSASNSLWLTMDRQVHTKWYTNHCVSQRVWLRADGGARQERWIGWTNLLWLLGYNQVKLVFPSWFSLYARYMGLILKYLLCESHSCSPFNTPSCLTPYSFRGHCFSLNNLTRSFSPACEDRKSISFRTSWTKVSTTLHCYCVALHFPSKHTWQRLCLFQICFLARQPSFQHHWPLTKHMHPSPHCFCVFGFLFSPQNKFPGEGDLSWFILTDQQEQR